MNLLLRRFRMLSAMLIESAENVSKILFFYISNGSWPPIGSTDEEDVVELARDLLSCFYIFLNFWNCKNCWNSSSESESS